MSSTNASDKTNSEIIKRLIQVEAKIDKILHGRVQQRETPALNGHPDQGFGGATLAQFGEDLAFLNIFQLLEIPRPSYLDIGAHHPLNINNTALLYERGSRGINVDANPYLMESFIQHRPEDKNLNIGIGPVSERRTFYLIDDLSGRNTFDREAANDFIREHPEFSISSELEVDVLTINEIIEEHCGGNFPDLLTIDVEGLDLDILKTADFSRSKPTVICVEAIFGGKKNNGKEITDFMSAQGFSLYFRTLANLIFLERQAFLRMMNFC